jgi:hypothetical protein
VKIKCFEIIALFLQKGELEKVTKIISTDLLMLLIDELNSSYSITEDSLYQKRMNKKFSTKMKKIITSNESFEKLINYRQNSNFNNEKLFA